MPSRTTEWNHKLPAISMSLEQFRAFVGDLRNHFPDRATKVFVRVRNGLETLGYMDLNEVNAGDPALPDVISGFKVEIIDAEARSWYEATYKVRLDFWTGASMNPNSGSAEGPSKAWVQGIAQMIRAGCVKRATWYSLIGFRGILIAIAIMMVVALDVLGYGFAPIQYHPAAARGLAYLLVSLVLLAVFALVDRLYFAVFPSATIVVRTGPRRWPYEALTLIFSIVALILAFLSFFKI